MIEIEVDVPKGFKPDSFEAACVELGLSYNRLTLEKYPGCIHWHVSKPAHKGTLEATWWPSKKRFWFSIHKNRRAAWHDRTVEQLDDLISTAQ